MKKALQGFWRGGLLGGLLGFLGGEVFVLGWSWMEVQQGSTDFYPYLSICWAWGFGQIPFVLPYIFVGFVIGAFLGIPFGIKLYDMPSIVRVVVPTSVMTVLYFMIGKDFWFRYIDEGNILYENNPGWITFKWVVFLLSSAAYGYSFRSEKLTWLKFLRKQVEETQEGIQ